MYYTCKTGCAATVAGLGACFIFATFATVASEDEEDNGNGEASIRRSTTSTGIVGKRRPETAKRRHPFSLLANGAVKELLWLCEIFRLFFPPFNKTDAECGA